MQELPDPVFASGMMGKAVGVWPDNGIVYAPVSGKVTTDMPHAIGIESDGIEVLVHIGVDTVNMAGSGFDLQVRRGESVRAGDVLLTFDRARVAKAGYSDVVMTIVMNTSEIESTGGVIETVSDGVVGAGDSLMRVMTS